MDMAQSHGVHPVTRLRNRLRDRLPQAPVAGEPFWLPRTWMAAGTLVAFATIAIMGYETLSYVPGSNPVPNRVHPEPLPPRVHPPAMQHGISGAGTGPWRQSRIVGPMPLGGRVMGTALHGRTPVVFPVTGTAPMPGKRTEGKPRPRPGTNPPPGPKGPASAAVDMKSRTIIGSMSSRTVTGNGGRLILEPRTMGMFAELERRWGEKLQVRWAYRDPRLNRKVGGAGRSLHLRKMALDIIHAGWGRDKMRRFVQLAYSIGFRGFGMGRSVIHIDTRPNLTSWNYGGNRYGLAYGMLGRGGPAKAMSTKKRYVAKKPTSRKAVAKKPVTKKRYVAKKPTVKKPVTKKRYVAKKPTVKKPVTRKKTLFPAK
jgi:hypothetical protein